MAIEKVIDIQIQSNSEQAVGSLRSQLRQAQADVATLSDKFGVTSREAIEAAKRAGELKDRIGDAKALTDAFNPDAKFKALSSSLAGVAGGFAAVQGGMALFGQQSEDVEKTLLKVQSAMALSQGLQAIGESVDSFKQLGAVVKSYSIVQKAMTAGQWLFNAAMNANPLGLIIVAITAVIAAGYGLIKFFGEVAITSKVAMMGIKENTKALEDSERITKKHNQALKENGDYQYNMAKASGASSEELRKLSLKQADADISLKQLNRTIAQNTYYRELNSLATLKASGATDEAIKMQDALVKKSLESFSNENKALNESLNNKKLLIQKNNVEVRQEQTNHTNKVKDEAKVNSDKLERERLEKAAKDKEAATKEAEDFFANAKEKSDKYEADLKIQQENQLAILQEGISGVTEMEDKAAADKKEKEDKIAADKKAADEKEIEFQKNKDSVIAASKQNLNNIIAGLEASGLNKSKAGQAISKAIALTQIGIDSAVAISKASTLANAEGVAAQLAFPLVPGIGTIARVVSYASTAATVIGNIARAKQLLSGGGAGGSTAGSAPSSGGAGVGGATPPSFNVVGSSSTNQLAQTIGQQQQQPIQAYVVANNVTTAQALNRNIIESATIGG